MKRRTSGAVALGVLATVVIVSVGLLELSDRSQAQIIDSEVKAEPVWSPVRSMDLAGEFAITAAITRADGVPIKSSTAGLITSVYATPGDSLTDGEPVFAVDGLDVVAMASERPMWRALAKGNKGTDVAAVQEFLLRGGFLDESAVDGAYGDQTIKAWTNYQMSLGIDRKAVTAPAPARFVWIPNNKFVVAAVSAAPGSTVAVGDALATGAPTVSSLKVTEPDDAPPLRDADAWSATYAGRTAPFDRTTGQLDPKAYDIPPSEAGPITLVAAYAEPVPAEVVPASAVLLDGDASCVVVDQTSPHTVDVVVIGGTLGATAISPIGMSEVLVNPAGAGVATTCSS